MFPLAKDEWFAMKTTKPKNKTEAKIRTANTRSSI